MRKLTVLSFLLAAVPLCAQAPQPGGSSPATRLVLHAAELTGQIRVDGLLDEPVWSTAVPATDFSQAYPNPGAPATERTEVRFVVGPDALYVGARMFDSHPDSIAGQLSRRDVTGTYSDRVLLFIGSHSDRLSAFHFGVNPRGVKQDTYQFDDTREDVSWDAVWDVETTVDSLGWTAEFRIPFSQLRFSSRVNGERAWDLGVMREIARREERSTWSPWTRNSPGFVSSFGELHGLNGVRAPSRLEILPYTSARLERTPGDRANPFFNDNEVGGSMGADVRYGLPGGLTLSGTINPDFGQVEVDPAVVNLTAFETFYPERRPFFVEGNDIFRFGEFFSYNSYGLTQYFYSRRVGRSPQRQLSGYQFVDTPDQSTILGAAKVSGKSNGWSVGIMDAVTSREEARFYSTLGEEGASAVEPLSNYLVGRVRRDLNGGNSVVGGLLTATNRDMSDTVFAPLLRSSAYAAGVDAQHSWNGREWTLSGFLTGSRVNGSDEVIAATQRSSARYYQRPDAAHLRYDPTRTDLSGYSGAIALARTGKWDGSLTYQETSPGFEVNDIGYQLNSDRRAFSAYLGRRVNQPQGYFRSHSYAVTTNHAYTYGGENIFRDVAARVAGTFRNFWSAQLNMGYNASEFSDRLTRGGPLAGALPSARFTTYVASDKRKPVYGDWTFSWSRTEGGQFDRTLSSALTMRPTTSLQVGVGPSYNWKRNTSQYVLSRADSLVTATFGRRYVFADVEQSTLSLDTRLNWTLSPTLSLQVFAQPYISAGDFENYKEFLTPGRYDFAVYGRDKGTITPAASGFTVDPDGAGPAQSFAVGNRSGQRDFTFRSLRGNAVLRWEYRPGSALFLVWQQLRSGETLDGDLGFGRDVSGIFDEPAQNVFLIKATYWLSR